jgi:carbonic anhydrase/acetyltransferase-like protein (isoleucine patch superfamily)
MIISFEEKAPELHKDVFIASDAVVLGQVRVGSGSSIWYGCVVRGDVHRITIGERTNIQDRSVLHVTTGVHPAEVGDEVTIGHAAVVHGCRVGSRTLVGIGAIVLDGVEIGEGSVVAAGALLPPGRSYPPGSLIVGAPATVKRAVTEDERAWVIRSAAQYVALAQRHLAASRQVPPDPRA